MRFVDHQQSFVAFLQLDEAGKIRDIAVHAVHPLDDNHRPAIVASVFAEQQIGGLPVVMGKGTAGGARQVRPFEDAVVGPRIMDHQVAPPSKWPMTVSFVAWPLTNTTVSSTPRNSPPMLQIAMQVFLARNQSAGQDAAAVLRCRLLYGLDYDRIARHPGVVITGEIDVFSSGNNGTVVRQALVDGKEGLPTPDLAIRFSRSRNCKYSGNRAMR